MNDRYGYFNDNYSSKSNGIIRFLRKLSPGTRVVLQYDAQPPASGIFQGFQNGTVILSNFNDFPGIVRIKSNRINAISVGSTQMPTQTPTQMPTQTPTQMPTQGPMNSGMPQSP